MFSAIFACKRREAIISLLTESAAPLRCSLNRADAEKELISRRCGSANDHRDSIKFVQEVARFVTSCFFGKKVARVVWKVIKSSDKVAKLATLRASLLLSSLCLTAAAHAFSNVHTRKGISGPRPIRGGSLSLIGLDHDMGLICVCCWTTGRLSESQRLFFFLKGCSHRCDLRFFFVAPLRN